MNIIPAIDIKNGKCVRLTQGKFDAVQVYSNDPVEFAFRWEREGAKFLHIVDLDGAEKSSFQNYEILKKIIKNVKIPVQVGGGINSEKIADTLISIGVERIIIGTMAIVDKPLFRKILKKYRDNIIVSLDGKNGRLAIKGWKEHADISAQEAAFELEKIGVVRFIYTDVTKDGTLTIPNYGEIKKLVEKINTPIIAAGGISSLVAIKKLKSVGVEGVIVGKALYENKISINEMLRI